MSTVLQVTPPEALERLQQVMQHYGEVRQLAPVRVLERTGRNLSLRLYELFSAEAARSGDVTFAAWLRGWRVGRNDPAESGPENTGMSAEALKRARKRMGGFASILAMVSTDGGRITLRGVRASARNPRRRILGGRKGLGGVAVAGTDAALRREGDVRLNFRAVATIEELNVREAGRRFLAVSWLHRQWRKLSQGAQKQQGVHRVLQNVNPRSRLGLLGEVHLNSSPANNTATLELSSRAPGVREVGQKHGLFARAINAVSADMARYALEQEMKQLTAEIGTALHA